MKISALVAVSLLTGAAWAEPGPQFDSELASPPVAASAPQMSMSMPLRLKLDDTLSSPGPVIEAQGLKLSDSIVAPAEAAVFEAEDAAEDADEQSDPATRQ